MVKWWRKELKKRRRLRRKVANVGGNRLDAKMERIAELKEKKNFIVKFATSVGGEVKKFATDNYRLLKQTLDLPYFREKRKQRAIDEYQERQAEIDEKERAEREKKEREFIEAEKKKQFDKLQRREKVEGEEPRRKFLRRLHRQYQKEEQEQRDKQNLERRRRNVEEAAAEARRRKHEAKELNDKRLHMFRKAQSSYWYKVNYLHGDHLHFSNGIISFRWPNNDTLRLRKLQGRWKRNRRPAKSLPGRSSKRKFWE